MAGPESSHAHAFPDQPFDGQSFPDNSAFRVVGPANSTSKVQAYANLRNIRQVLGDGSCLQGTDTRIEPFVFRTRNGDSMAAENAGLEGFAWTEDRFQKKFGTKESARQIDYYLNYTLALFSSTPGFEAIIDKLKEVQSQSLPAEDKYKLFKSTISETLTNLRSDVDALDQARWIRDIRSYQIFVRAFNLESRREAFGLDKQETTGRFFADLNESDLAQLKSIGFSSVRFMGTYPIGEVGRKGDGGGSPFALKEHTIDPQHGQPEEVKACIKMLERNGLKSVFELVLNHTAIDSTLVQQDPSLFVHSRTKPAHPEQFFHVNHPEKGEFWVRYGGYRDDRTAGREYWKDTLQLDLTNPETRRVLIDTAKGLVRDYGVNAFRVDMAYQMLNSYFLHNWEGEVARPKVKTEFLEELITSVKSEFPDVAFVAEGYGRWDDLSHAGFDLIYGFNSMTRLGGHLHTGWYQALKSQEPQQIRSALDRVEFLEWQKGGSGMVTFLGTHDNPSPVRAFGNFVWGASALTILKPGAFLFLGGTCAKFEAPDPIDGKMITFESPVKIDWSGVKSEYGQKIHELLSLSGNIAKQFTNAELHHLEPNDPNEKWVGYYMTENGALPKAEKVAVLVNMASTPTTVTINRPEIGITDFNLTLPPMGPNGYQTVFFIGRD